MGTYRLFCYNPSANGNISGTEQVGDIAAATGSVTVDTSKEWWNGPDEDLGYVVCYVDASGNRPNSTERLFGGNIPCHLGFKRSIAKTDESFLTLSKRVTGSQSLASATDAKTLLNTNGYWTSWVATAASLLLDTYGGAAAAYSLRKLSTSYSGSAIRVRRSSDNTEQNIGFDGSGNLDTTALTAFVGAGNGFVTTWYDQSGNNRNFTQSTANLQPTIVSAGTVLLQSGKPKISLLGGKWFTSNTTYSISTRRDSFFVTNNDGDNQFLYPDDWGSYDYAYGYVAGDGSSSTNLFYNPNSTPSLYVNNTLQSVTTRAQVYTALNGYKLVGHENFRSIYGTFNLGRYSGYEYGGSFQEVIYYFSDQSSNRSGINTNINTYYSVYPSDADAAAFVSAAGITDSTQQSAINTLVTDLKAAGLWTKMKAIYPFVGGTATTHKYNLKDPQDTDAAFRLVFSGGWTHTSNGAQPNGSNGYANTYLIPNNNLTEFNTHISYYSRTNNYSNLQETFIGTQYTGGWTGGQSMIIMYYSTTLYSRHYMSGTQVSGGSSIQLVNNNRSGLFISSRTSNVMHKLYKNNTTLFTNTTADINEYPWLNGSITGRNFDRLLGPISLGSRYDYSSNTFSDYSAQECAFATIGDGLSDAEAAAFYTAVQAFQTTLGRQV